MTNPNVTMTLEEAVEEVLTVLTGQDLRYDPDMDRYRVVTKFLNRALRANALEAEWSYYSDLEDVGVVHAGDEQIAIRSTVRVRGIGDDAVRLIDQHGRTVVWAASSWPQAANRKTRLTGNARGRKVLRMLKDLSQMELGIIILASMLLIPNSPVQY